MKSKRFSTFGAAVLATIALIAVLMSPSGAQPPPPPSDGKYDHEFATPLLGMNAFTGRNRLMIADTGAGLVRMSRSSSSNVLFFPGVADVVPINTNKMFVVTGEPPPEGGEMLSETELQGPPPDPWGVYAVRVRSGAVRKIADLNAHEMAENPDGAQVHSNPFRLAKVGPNLIVTDAAANAAIAVNVATGGTSTMATFPPQIVTTQWLKDGVGCPEPPDPENAELCDLPPQMPAEAVPTGIAFGPDGYVYIGELSGFPAGPGSSRIWRMRPGARNVECGVDPECELFGTDFTSIVDLNFTSDGQLVVGEMDLRTFIAAEAGEGIGGAVQLCDTVAFECRGLRRNIPLLTSVAVGRDDRIFASTWALIPGSADVRVVGKA